MKNIEMRPDIDGRTAGEQDESRRSARTVGTGRGTSGSVAGGGVVPADSLQDVVGAAGGGTMQTRHVRDGPAGARGPVVGQAG